MYSHEVRVRYGDCDMQQVVFNAHYLAYSDDAVMCWLLNRLAARMPEFDCVITRWGNSSFDVLIHGHVAGESSFDITIVYVSTTPGAPKPTPVPEWVRAALRVDEELTPA